MGYHRNVSANSHQLAPEGVWHIQLPEVRFGPNAAEELGHQLQLLGVDSPSTGIVITDSTLADLGHADRIQNILEAKNYQVDIFDKAKREPSVRDVNTCIEFVRDNAGEEGYDFYVGLGGGSCLDTAKATRTVLANGGELIDYIAEPTGNGKPISNSGAPLVLMPTTAGTGSEISPIAVFSVEEKETKEAISDNKVRGDVAVLDPTLTTTLPPEMTAASAMDALGHAIEGYTTHEFSDLLRAENPADRSVYAGRTPFTEMFSEKAIKLLSSNVREVVNNGENLEARTKMLQGALFGAIAGLSAGAHLCHAMAYPVGNRFHSYHGQTIAVLTPATTLGYNVASDPERFARVGRMLGANTDALSVREAAETAREEYLRLQRDLNVVPSGLTDLAGVTEDDTEWLATQTVDTQKRLLRCNPRPVTKEDVQEAFNSALSNWN